MHFINETLLNIFLVLWEVYAIFFSPANVLISIHLWLLLICFLGVSSTIATNEEGIEELSFRSLLPSESHRRGSLERQKSRRHESDEESTPDKVTQEVQQGVDVTIMSVYIYYKYLQVNLNRSSVAPFQVDKTVFGNSQWRWFGSTCKKVKCALHTRLPFFACVRKHSKRRLKQNLLGWNTRKGKAEWLGSGIRWLVLLNEDVPLCLQAFSWYLLADRFHLPVPALNEIFRDLQILL